MINAINLQLTFFYIIVYFRPYEAAGKLWTMVIPRIIFTLVLFQFTMMGLFLLGKSYILGGLCIPLVFITFIFKYLLDRAYKDNGRNLPMQLLRDNIEKLPNGSDIEEDDSSGDELLDSEKVSTPGSKNKSHVSTIEDTKAKEEKLIARNRWKKAALSAVNLKTEPSVEEKSIIVRPRRRKLVLDEDDYEATPDRLTDYRQPPMQLNPGLLDAGLKEYGNPLLVGVLPQLWLPVRVPVEGEENKPALGHRKSDFLHNRISGGGNLAQHLAEILRKVESENKSEADLRNKTSNTLDTPSSVNDGAEDSLMEDSKKKAHKDAATIVTGKPNQKIAALRSLFKRGAIKQSNISTTDSSVHDLSVKDLHSTDDATMDSVERGQHGSIVDHSSTRSASSKSVHQIYYHHPERRKSHTSDMDLPLPRRPEYKQSGLSAPAFVPDVEDNEAMASTIVRPDTQNSRHSSAPLLNKGNKEK